MKRIYIDGYLNVEDGQEAVQMLRDGADEAQKLANETGDLVELMDGDCVLQTFEPEMEEA